MNSKKTADVIVEATPDLTGVILTGQTAKAVGVLGQLQVTVSNDDAEAWFDLLDEAGLQTLTIG